METLPRWRLFLNEFFSLPFRKLKKRGSMRADAVLSRVQSCQLLLAPVVCILNVSADWHLQDVLLCLLEVQRLHHKPWIFLEKNFFRRPFKSQKRGFFTSGCVGWGLAWAKLVLRTDPAVEKCLRISTWDFLPGIGYKTNWAAARSLEGDHFHRFLPLLKPHSNRSQCRVQ